MFKYLSGDFVAEYNRVIKNLKEEQAIIDEKYSDIIDNMVKREAERLDKLTPMPFNAGDKVRLFDRSKSGTVVSCPVNLNVHYEDWQLESRFGPGKFFPLTSEKDEVVITCDGDLRKVVVMIETDELSKDWGLENAEIEYWPDELEFDD